MIYQRRVPVSIPIPEEILAKVRQQEAILAEQGIAEKSFQQAVKQKIAEKGISFILAVYQTFDEFFEREMEISGVTLACKKGCAQCCNVLIFCTEEEINEVLRFIRSLPRATRIPLIKRVMAYAREWRDYYRNNEFNLRLKPFKSLGDWAGKPCCFLNEESRACEIYPVRITDCRTLTSLTPCVSGNMQTILPCELRTPGPGRYRFRCESWASNFIMEEQQRKLGLPSPQLSPVTPVYHWLWMKRKEF